MFENIKRTVVAKKDSYQATAGMYGCLALASLFLLGAGFIWLGQYLGLLLASLSFAGVFLLLALCFKLVSTAREAQAAENIEAVEEKASDAVDAVAATAHTIASVPVRPSILIPALVVAGILLVLIDRPRESSASQF